LLAGNRWVVLGDNHDLACGKLTPQDSRGLEPIHAGHIDVHEDYVGTKQPGLFKGFDSVASFTADVPMGLILYETTEGPPEQFMVVRNQDFEDVIHSFRAIDFLAIAGQPVGTAQKWVAALSIMQCE
jgi:hypothetical protein